MVGRNGSSRDDDGALSAPRDTGERETIECGLVLRSIGYKGIADRRGPLRRAPRHDPERRAAASSTATASQVPGEYVAGWIKRGPSGVIGTNKKDAQETVEQPARGRRGRAAARAGDADRTRSRTLLAERGVEPVSYEGWEAIDAHEQERGEPHGRPRVKFCRVEEMLEARAAARAADRMADLGEVKGMIEAALPGAEVEVVDETRPATTCGRPSRRRSSRG